MSSRRRKRIKRQSQRSQGRIRSAGPVASDINNNERKPIFSLEYMVSDYSIARCNAEQKAAFADALWSRSQMTWRQIIQAPRHGLGSEQIPRHAIRVGIPHAITEDVSGFIAIRFYDNAPMIGFRTGQIFYIVWLDIKFSVYDHGS